MVDKPYNFECVNMNGMSDDGSLDLPVSGENGGAEGTRTPDIYTASVVFSQLNYSPTAFDAVIIPRH